MRAGHIELFVRDPQAAKAFYTAFGFECTDEQGGGKFVWLRLGDREVLLRPGSPPPGGVSYQQARAGMVVFTDDLDAELARLRGHGIEPTGNDGPGCPTFTDPDGNWIQLANPA